MTILWPDILGYDIFVSYVHDEASPYASKLQKMLRDADFRCFLDKNDTAPGLELRDTLERALRKSQVFVFIGTTSALSRPWVVWELRIFEGFRTNGRMRRKSIIPIDVDQNCRNLPDKGEHLRVLDSLIWVEETSAAIKVADPSPAVIGSIQKHFTHARRNQVWRRISVAVLLVVVVLAAVALAAGVRARREAGARQTAVRERDTALNARESALNERDRAFEGEKHALQTAVIESGRAAAAANKALQSARKELAARQRAEDSSSQEFAERLKEQQSSFDRDVGAAMLTQYQALANRTRPSTLDTTAPGSSVAAATVQLENSRTLPQCFRISYPVHKDEPGQVTWHFEHRFFDSRRISRLSEQLKFVRAFGLLTRADEELISDAQKSDAVSSVYLIVRYEGDLNSSPFLLKGRRIDEETYAGFVRKAMWMALGEDPQFGYRARLLTDDRLWRQASNIGNPSALRMLFPSLGLVQSTVVISDYLKASQWAFSMSNCSREIETFLQGVAQTRGTDQDSRITEYAEQAEHALSRLAMPSGPISNFHEPWGLLAMYLADGGSAAVEVTISGAGQPIRRKSDRKTDVTAVGTLH